MIEPLYWPKLSLSQRKAALERPVQLQSVELIKVIQNIFAGAHEQGWTAISDWALQFDGFVPRKWDIDEASVTLARKHLDSDQLKALEFAAKNIRHYHQQLLPRSIRIAMDHYEIERVWRPINPIGLYVPGGTAPLVSTLLMTAIPARIAGVDDIVTTTPPSADGGPHPMMVVAAGLAGLNDIWTLGGAQAIAAMALGTNKIPKCAKIFGPGNAYVSAAKLYATTLPRGPAIDLPAGPSELMIMADKNANPEFIAWDLLSQAEHDALAQVILIANDTQFIQKVVQKVAEFISQMPREKIARASMSHARFIRIDELSNAIDIANRYAPEHLALHLEGAPLEEIMPQIENAGTVFAGPWAAETFGDYVSGPSHVLPTHAAAQAWGGIGLESFLKPMAIQKVTRRAAKEMSKPASTLARMEGLEAHAMASKIRSKG